MSIGSVALKLGIVLILAVLGGCATDHVNSREQHANLKGIRAASDCTSLIEKPFAAQSVLADTNRFRIIRRYWQHYHALSDEVLKADAEQLLLRPVWNSNRPDSRTNRMVTRFDIPKIPVYVYSRETKTIRQSLDAVNRINAALPYPRLIPKEVHLGTEEFRPMTAGNKGIHLYFGSVACARRVFREQASLSESDFETEIQPKLTDLGGIALTQILSKEGTLTGEIVRAIVVVLDTKENQRKQNVIQRELMRALGVQGRTRSILWSNMSLDADRLAPVHTLSAFDEEVLHTLYDPLLPGDGEIAVRAILRHKFRRLQTLPLDECAVKFVSLQNVGQTFKGPELLNNVLCGLGVGNRKAS